MIFLHILHVRIFHSVAGTARKMTAFVKIMRNIIARTSLHAMCITWKQVISSGYVMESERCCFNGSFIPAVGMLLSCIMLRITCRCREIWKRQAGIGQDNRDRERVRRGRLPSATLNECELGQSHTHIHLSVASHKSFVYSWDYLKSVLFRYSSWINGRGRLIWKGRYKRYYEFK